VKYPDLTGKLLIHTRSGQRLRVWKRISRYYYAVHHVYSFNHKDHFVAGTARVGHLFRAYYEVIPNPAVIPWHALCNKYPEFDDSAQ
jgi:hypothetical protein